LPTYGRQFVVPWKSLLISRACGGLLSFRMKSFWELSCPTTALLLPYYCPTIATAATAATATTATAATTTTATAATTTTATAATATYLYLFPCLFI